MSTAKKSIIIVFRVKW